MINRFLVGTNIYLRPLERPDAPALVTWLNEPEVTHFLNAHKPMTVRAEEEFIDHIDEGDDLVLGIVLREGDRLIGVAGLHQIDQRCRRAAFGIFVGDKTQWGKGFGTEATRLILGHAFQTLNLNRVWLHVFEYNARGVRAYEKAGFRREGVLPQDTFRDGRYWDTITMAVLREEWRKEIA
ncbi:MAG TPA: GNAT family protein [Gemmataceae bacterium]|nr:GNAT family protein [Gemmataceae bacterium]